MKSGFKATPIESVPIPIEDPDPIGRFRATFDYSIADMEDRRNQFQEFVLRQPRKTKKVVDPMCQMMMVNKNSVWHSFAELYVYYELAAGMHDVSENSGHIIHCGVHRGGSLCVMAEAVRIKGLDKPIWAIDPFHLDWTFRDNPNFWEEALTTYFVTYRVFELIDKWVGRRCHSGSATGTVAPVPGVTTER